MNELKGGIWQWSHNTQSQCDSPRIHVTSQAHSRPRAGVQTQRFPKNSEAVPAGCMRRSGHFRLQALTSNGLRRAGGGGPNICVLAIPTYCASHRGDLSMEGQAGTPILHESSHC